MNACGIKFTNNIALEKLKKLEKKNSSSREEITRTVDLCLRLLSVPSATAEQPRRGHVLLSCNESTKALVQKLNTRLWAAGLSTCLQLCDGGVGSMAVAVERSAAVLLCCGSGYRSSDCCKKQAEYAAALKVPLIFGRP